MTDEYLPSTDLNVATGEEDTETVITNKGTLLKRIFLMIFYIELFR